MFLWLGKLLEMVASSSYSHADAMFKNLKTVMQDRCT